MAGRRPSPDARRTNAATIPTTSLPASGRKWKSHLPRCPYELEAAGAEWWAWAWRTPQACAWSSGDTFVVARRARLEDRIVDLESVADFDLRDFGLEGEERLDEVNRRLRSMLALLKSMAGGRSAIEREMRELDDRLGLTPKGMATLRWTIVEDAPAAAAPGEGDGASSASPFAGRRAELLAS